MATARITIRNPDESEVEVLVDCDDDFPDAIAEVSIHAYRLYTQVCTDETPDASWWTHLSIGPDA